MIESYLSGMCVCHSPNCLIARARHCLSIRAYCNAQCNKLFVAPLDFVLLLTRLQIPDAKILIYGRSFGFKREQPVELTGRAKVDSVIILTECYPSNHQAVRLTE